MAANTGRTVSRWVNFIVDDSGGTIRQIPINSINGVGLECPEKDLTAWNDAIKGALPETPECVIEIEGPFDTSTAAAVGTLSGSHTILNGIIGLSTPLTLDVQVGMRHAWETGEPQFGLTSSTTAGFLCTSYKVNVNDGTCSAKFVVFPGSTAPAWGTAAES